MKRFESFSLLTIVAAVGICYGGSLGIFFFGEIYYAFSNFINTDDPHILTGGGGYGFRPVRGLFYYGLFSAFGLNPLPFRIASVLVHLFSSILVFYVVSRFTEKKELGLFTALLFATSWLNSQAVCWLTAVHEVLWPFFGLLTVVCFYQFRHKGGLLYYGLSLVCLLLAMGSKENAFVLPGVLLLVDWYYRGVEWSPMGILLDLRDGLRRGPVLAILPFFALALMHLLILKRSSAVWGAGLGGDVEVHNLMNLGRTFHGFYDDLTYAFGVPFVVRGKYIVNSGITTLSITALVYLFTSEEHRRRITLLMASLLVLILPLSFLGTALHYISCLTVVSLTLSVLVLYEGSGLVAERLARKAPVWLTKAVIAYGIFFSLYGALLVWNYRFVHQTAGYYHRMGNIVHSFLKTLEDSFPKGDLKKENLLLVNFPRLIEPPFWPRFTLTRAVIWDNIEVPLAVHLGKDCLPTISLVNVPLDDEKLYGKWKAYEKRKPHKKRKPYDNEVLYTKDISLEEFDILSKDKNHRVYFFNLADESIREVTGYDHTGLQKLLVLR